MFAKIGDRLIVKGNRVGQPERVGRIVEVRGEKGQPPYVVQWSDDEHEALIFPGPDAIVQHSRSKSR